MANGLKRTVAQDTQSRSKKTKTSKRTSAPAVTAISSSPSKELDEDGTDNDQDTTNAINDTKSHLDGWKARLKQENKWPNETKQYLTQQQTKVLAQLDTMKNEIESKQETFREGILPVLRKAMAPIDDAETPEVSDESTLEVPILTAGQQVYFNQVAELLNTSHRLINTYHEVREGETKSTPSRLPEMERDFKKDQEAALSTIDAGRRVAARDIETMLADRHCEVRGRSNLTREEEQKGRMLLARCEDDDEEEDSREVMGWGMVAADARSAIKKLDKVGQLQRGV